MIKLLIERTELDKQTLGKMSIFKNDELVGIIRTLELPYLDNQRSISSIPKGEYKIEKYNSERFHNAFEVQNVPGRSKILIHAGNFNKDTHGCILVGFRHIDINADGLMDVAESQKAMNFLNKVCELETLIELTIV